MDQRYGSAEQAQLMLRALASGSVVPTAADKAAAVRQGCLWGMAFMVKHFYISFGHLLIKKKKKDCRSWCCYELLCVSSVATLGRGGKCFAAT